MAKRYKNKIDAQVFLDLDETLFVTSKLKQFLKMV